MTMGNGLTVSGCVIVGLVAWLDAANAHPRAIPPMQLQRISADLMRSDAQDFFRVGRIKLEREVQTIYEPRLQEDANLLMIDSSVPPHPDLAPLEMPTVKPLTPPKP